MKPRTRCKLAALLCVGTALAHVAATEHHLAPSWVRIPLAVVAYAFAFRIIHRSHASAQPAPGRSES